MPKKPMFTPNPDGSEGYLLTLAGVLLLTGDVIFGDSTKTTPQGRTNAMRIVERSLQEAEKRGFKHSSTVWALMRRNDISPRLVNLVDEAVNLIPNQVQAEIMLDIKQPNDVAASAISLVTATKHPGRHEPETNPRFLRPGSDGIDPRFWQAGHELKRIAKEEGPEAIHKPEHAHLYAQLLRYSPTDLRMEMEAKAHELDLIREATHVDENGETVYSAQQIADRHGVIVEEVEQLIAKSDFDPDELYTGPVFPKL